MEKKIRTQHVNILKKQELCKDLPNEFVKIILITK